MHERALARRRRRRLGQPLEVGEPERERAARERAHRAGGERRGGFKLRAMLSIPRAVSPRDHPRPCPARCHTATIQPPCDSFGHGQRPYRFSRMKVDTGIMAPSLAEIGRAGDASWRTSATTGCMTAETAHDPFLPLVDRGRAHRAHRARDRHRGRVRPHPDAHRVHGQRPAARTRRAASSSASARRSSRTSRSGSRCRGRIRRARMREYILAMRAIWASWNDGDEARLPRRLLPRTR